MLRRTYARRGYTLLEMLAVVTIIGILMTLTAGAAFKYMGSARQRATEAVITTIDLALTQRYESFVAKVKPPAMTRHLLLAGGSTITTEPGSVIKNRAALIAKLEAMRGDFPQQFADFLPATNGLATEVVPPAPPTAPSAPVDRTQAVPSRVRAAIEREYRRLTFEKNPGKVPNNDPKNIDPSKPTQISPHDASSESGACLYLMLKVGSGEGGSFDMSQIPASFVKDTDDDGVPEFIDSWGTPLRFYRWPTDLLTFMALTSNQLGGGGARNQNSLDPEKLLARNFWATDGSSAFFETNISPSSGPIGCYFRVHDPADSTGKTPISMPIYPTIVSAGPDAMQYSKEDRWQAFGLTWDDSAASSPSNPTPSGAITISWPLVNNLAARCAAPITTTGAAGAKLPGAGAYGDNIYSRVLRAGQESN